MSANISGIDYRNNRSFYTFKKKLPGRTHHGKERDTYVWVDQYGNYCYRRVSTFWVDCTKQEDCPLPEGDGRHFLTCVASARRHIALRIAGLLDE